MKKHLLLIITLLLSFNLMAKDGDDKLNQVMQYCERYSDIMRDVSELRYGFKLNQVDATNVIRLAMIGKIFTVEQKTFMNNYAVVAVNRVYSRDIMSPSTTYRFAKTSCLNRHKVV
jgi:hypothetical protein